MASQRTFRNSTPDSSELDLSEEEHQHDIVVESKKLKRGNTKTYKMLQLKNLPEGTRVNLNCKYSNKIFD